MIVLALDPGHTTGWAVVTEEKVVATGMFSGYSGMEALIEQHSPDMAVIENFLLHPWRTNALAWSQLKTVQTLGIMKYILTEAGVPFVLQSSSLVKQSSKRLIGKYSSQHERDAVTHGIVYLQRQGLATKALTKLIWRRE